MIRVVVKEPGYRAAIRQVTPGLESIQKIVGGYLTTALLGDGFFDGGSDRLVVYCDEDGMAKDLPLSFFRVTDGHPILGSVIAMKVDTQGEDVSMTEADAEKARVLLDTMALPGDQPPTT